MAGNGQANLVVNPYRLSGVDNTVRSYVVEGTVTPVVGPTNFAVTAWSITSNVLTLTAANTLSSGGGQAIVVSGFATSTFLNGPYTTSSATGSTIVVPLTHANASATEAGVATLPAPAGTTIAITAYQVATNVLTLTAVNSLNTGGGQVIVVSGFASGNAFVNGTYTVTSATGTTIVAPLTHADAGPTTAAGTATLQPSYTTGGIPISYNFVNASGKQVVIGGIGPLATPKWIQFQTTAGSTLNYKVDSTAVPNKLLVFTGITQTADAVAIPADTIAFRAEFSKDKF